ncbi:hypothetical protein DY000_02035238 [Brassica cretica]|uniref:Uncharacterized protein n=1 Tax=Brassica cretica TaxID=69181 RepID=A0ABQ7DQK5_BRACR|nr:hypothetical protein DY000_02035238 [Brassica cretica]
MKSSEFPEEFPRKFRGNPKFGFLGISSEYTDGIPRKYQSVGIFRGNSEEKCVPRKRPMNSEEIAIRRYVAPVMVVSGSMMLPVSQAPSICTCGASSSHHKKFENSLSTEEEDLVPAMGSS